MNRSRINVPRLLGLPLLAMAVAMTALALSPNAGTTSAATEGASMSLSINGQTGTVNVTNNSTAPVAVNAESSPQLGYDIVQAWVDFGSTGLVGKKNPQGTWVDCDPATFVSGQLGNAENAGCLTSIGTPFASIAKGEILTFDFTCDQDGSHTITLLAIGDLVASHSGAAFGTRSGIVPADYTEAKGRLIADTIDVNCVPAIATPPPVGGVSLSSNLGALPLETRDSGDSRWLIAGGVAGAVLFALGGAAWYTSRRTLH